MTNLVPLLAFGWQPEVRGIVVVMIGVGVLMGSVYLLLGTNLGARLGFLVAAAALFGWMFIMGSVWWAYGIGLKGKDPTWVAVEVVNGDLSQAATSVAANPNLTKATTDQRSDGWILLKEDDPKRGQAVASADDILVNQTKRFKAGDYIAENVYDYGGNRYPNISFHTRFGTWNIDYLAFLHGQHYSIVQVRPVVPQTAEPGKAPPKPVADESQNPVYVVMKRDRGTKRWPAAMIALGSAILFFLLCWRLHTRDRTVNRNRAQSTEVEPRRERVGAGV